MVSKLSLVISFARARATVPTTVFDIVQHVPEKQYVIITSLFIFSIEQGLGLRNLHVEYTVCAAEHLNRVSAAQLSRTVEDPGSQPQPAAGRFARHPRWGWHWTEPGALERRLFLSGKEDERAVLNLVSDWRQRYGQRAAAVGSRERVSRLVAKQNTWRCKIVDNQQLPHSI